MVVDNKGVIMRTDKVDKIYDLCKLRKYYILHIKEIQELLKN